MKQGRTLQEVAMELERQRVMKRDYLIPTTVMRMTAEGELVADGIERLSVSDTAHDQIGSHLEIPAKYYRKMREEQPELLASNVNTWFDAKPTTRMVRTLDGTARAFLSKQYRCIDNYEIAMAVLPILGEMEIDVVSSEVTENKLYFKAVNPRIETEISKGDVVQAGIVISNSETGHGSVSVMPMVYRLVCTNGMIAADHGMRKYHVGRENVIDVDFQVLRDETRMADDKALMMKVQDTVRAAAEEARFIQIVDRMKEAAGMPILSPDIPKVVELVGKDYLLLQSEQVSVLDHLIRGGDLSLYGLANAVTRHSQDVETYDRATELEAVGWQIMNTDRYTWDAMNKAAA